VWWHRIQKAKQKQRSGVAISPGSFGKSAARVEGANYVDKRGARTGSDQQRD
jgi:hypothetical protein